MPGNNNDDLFNQWQQNYIKSERFAKQAEREAKETELFSKLQKRMLDNNKEYLRSLIDIEKIQKRIAELEQNGLTHQEAHVATLKEIKKQYEDVQNEKVEKLKEEYQFQMKINALKDEGIDYIIKETQERQKYLDNEVNTFNILKEQAIQRNASAQDLKAIYASYSEKFNEQARNQAKLTKLTEIQSINSKQTLNFKQKIFGFEDKIAKKQKEIDVLKDEAAALTKAEDPAGAASKMAQAEALAAGLTKLNIAATIGKAVEAIGNMLFQKFTQKVDQAISVYSTYMGKIEARLQSGNEFDNYRFTSIVDKIFANATTTPFYSAERVVEAVESLSSEGIAFNIAERAFLSSISDKLVAAFEINDATLTRLIRLYHTDITRAMLGNEANLTKMFNQFFEDTKYLTSGLYDQVSAAIYDAQSMLNYEGATEFNYAVQKWLGALYEAGVAESTVSQISTGLNYLATGDVTSLNSNQQLAVLLNMAAARGGLSYAEMLTSGIDAKSVNILLNSIIDVLKDIATNTGDNVTKSAYRDILGVNVSDLQAIQRIDQSIISSIANQTLTYESAKFEAKNQISQLIERTTLAENVENVLNNMMSSVAYEIADNGAQYALWKIGGIIGQIGDTIDSKIVSGVGLTTQLSAGLWGLVERLSTNFKLGSLKSISRAEAEQFIDDAGLTVANTNKIARTGLAEDAWTVTYQRGPDRLSRWSTGADKLAGAMERHSVADAISESAEFQNSYYVEGGGFLGAVRSGALKNNGDETTSVNTSDYGVGQQALSTNTSDYDTGPQAFSLGELADNVEQTAQKVVSVQDVSANSVEDIYTKLFETQDVPIKVNISTIDNAALNLLVEALQIANVAEIKDILNNKVSVDIVDQDINSIVDTLRAVRSL